MEQKCENCKLRAYYDRNPKSFLGRFWRWHINFCLSDEKKKELREQYNFTKY